MVVVGRPEVCRWEGIMARAAQRQRRYVRRGRSGGETRKQAAVACSGQRPSGAAYGITAVAVGSMLKPVVDIHAA